MDETGDSKETVVDEMPVVHQLGRTVVGGIAAFAADKLATRVYDATLRALRARRSS